MDKYFRQFYPANELALELGKSIEYINSLHKAGIIRGIRMGKQLVYSAEELGRVFKDYEGMELTNLDAMISAKAVVDRIKNEKEKSNSEKKSLRRLA